MTDQEHAARIRAMLEAYGAAIASAVESGLDISVQTDERRTIQRTGPRTYMEISVKIGRPL